MNFEEEYRRRIGKFLSQRIDILDSRYGYGSDEVIRQGIRELVKNGIYTTKELQFYALTEELVYIPEYFIKQCVNS